MYFTNTKMKGIHFVQVNGKLKNENKHDGTPYKAIKKILRTKDSSRTMEVDRPMVLQLPKNKEDTEKNLQVQNEFTKNGAGRSRANRKVAQNLVHLSTDHSRSSNDIFSPTDRTKNFFGSKTPSESETEGYTKNLIK